MRFPSRATARQSVEAPTAGRFHVGAHEAREPLPSRRMKIAFLVYGFPNLSETFILNQITGLLDAGHDVHVHAWRSPVAEKVHDDVRRYRLLERTHYRDIPGRYLARLAATVRRT